MKTRVLLLFLFLSTAVFSAGHGTVIPGNGAPSRPDSLVCLEIEAKVVNSDQDGSLSKVELLIGDRVVDSVFLRGKHRKFKFQFKKNEHYTIRISKPGFVSKSVCVHTQMQSWDGLVYQFYFETTLVYSKPNSVEQPPVATIYFNQQRNCFYYTRSNPFVPGKANCIKSG